MADNPENPESGEEQGPDINEAISALTQEIQTLKEESSKPEPKPEPEPEPKPEPPKPAQPPEEPEGRTRDARERYLRQLGEFATQQAQEAYAYKLAHNFGEDINPEQLLEENYSRPEDMRAAAERIADKAADDRRIRALEEKLQALEEERAQPSGGGEEPPTPASVDTGGPTSTQSDAERELQQRYDAAEEAGRTREGRQHLLDAIYRDPKKVLGRHEE